MQALARVFVQLCGAGLVGRGCSGCRCYNLHECNGLTAPLVGIPSLALSGVWRSQVVSAT